MSQKHMSLYCFCGCNETLQKENLKNFNLLRWYHSDNWALCKPCLRKKTQFICLHTCWILMKYEVWSSIMLGRLHHDKMHVGNGAINIIIALTTNHNITFKITLKTNLKLEQNLETIINWSTTKDEIDARV